MAIYILGSLAFAGILGFDIGSWSMLIATILVIVETIYSKRQSVTRDDFHNLKTQVNDLEGEVNKFSYIDKKADEVDKLPEMMARMKFQELQLEKLERKLVELIQVLNESDLKNESLSEDSEEQ